MRLTRVSLSSGVLGHKYVEGGAPQVLTCDDECIKIASASITIPLAAITGYSLAVQPFKESVLGLEARFVHAGRTRQYVQLFFPSAELAEVEELLTRRGIRRLPTISAVMLDYPLSRFYAPTVRKAVGVLAAAYPLVILACSLLELYIRLDKRANLGTWSAEVQQRGLALAGALYAALPTWAVVVAGIVAVPLVPFLWLYWVFVAAIAFSHQIVMVLLFGSIVFVNFARVAAQLRGILVTLVGVPAILRQLLAVLPAGLRAKIITTTKSKTT
jgi:hypothetical protein